MGVWMCVWVRGCVDVCVSVCGCVDVWMCVWVCEHQASFVTRGGKPCLKKVCVSFFLKTRFRFSSIVAENGITKIQDPITIGPQTNEYFSLE